MTEKEDGPLRKGPIADRVKEYRKYRTKSTRVLPNRTVMRTWEGGVGVSVRRNGPSWKRERTS